ncbi:endoglucanase [Marchantia polymorpha subsp. ruderalis]|uniref:glucan 1,3-beta-glucosidase n=1 Tax=Marchantia polymorpha TaxID=3197 RepID=A0A2R6W1Y7_MARPO|nr:hypothetical protein MARPO_0180s0004 [Marchantia polymorpha]BBN00763.1 hypothetical protein Mp_2g01900 [Marchantia polymorpha subsp. ruderalis]|eukprot:PTQ27879.1 hypothetical protein MARPO_0180s0004 [Marchantia polymorpha]
MGIAALLCLAIVLSASSAARAWLPTKHPIIRGVNLGGLFVVEPWMMNDRWASMGCAGLNDEWQCVKSLGQKAADAAFKRHWSSWITKADIDEIVSYGLNTIRIPLGFWMKEDLVQSDEYFPRGGFKYLESVVRMAKKAGLYVILDLHAGPGGQFANQQFTGHSVSTPGFFTSANYERACQFLEWIAKIKHTNPNFATVGTLEVMNEPRSVTDEQRASLRNEFYPNAYNRIRQVEDDLNIAQEKRLHIQMMATSWGEGDPDLSWGGHSPYLALYDDHKYLVWDTGVPATRRDYMYHSCYNNVGAGSNSNDKPLLVGEWSLGVRDGTNSEFNLTRSDAVEWYKGWFAAQLHDYEMQKGWVFWTWKIDQLDGQNDFRWGYQRAVKAGVIPTNPAKAIAMNICDNYK